MNYKVIHIDGGAYDKNGHIKQYWIKYYYQNTFELNTSVFVMLKNGNDSKKLNQIFIKYTKVDICPCCKKLKNCNYSKFIIWEALKNHKYIFDEHSSINICKSCYMKFLNIDNQFSILHECLKLLTEMKKEIRNANTNSRTVKRVPMYAIAGD